MSNGKLFVAYSYIGKEKDGNVIYNGFNNMICHRLVYPPQGIEHIEELENMCAEHCKQSVGLETAACTIINWKWMTGDQ